MSPSERGHAPSGPKGTCNTPELSRRPPAGKGAEEGQSGGTPRAPGHTFPGPVPAEHQQQPHLAPVQPLDRLVQPVARVVAAEAAEWVLRVAELRMLAARWQVVNVHRRART